MASLQRHRQLSEHAHECLSKALDGETNASLSIQTILALYEQGHAALKEALELPMTLGERCSVDTENSKMLRNLLRTEERMEVLKSKMSVTARPWSGGAFHLTLHVRPCPHSKSLENPHEVKHSPAVTRRSVAGVKRQGSSSSLPPERIKHPTANPGFSRKALNLKNVDKDMAHMILNQVLMESPSVSWNDVVGLDSAKKALMEIVVYPALRPELFMGLRAPARGVLLFGPPGTGKTMLAKAVATTSKATFFPISASSLTSKFFGEGEKIVKTLFQMAKELQPSVIFIGTTRDEVDSILTERSESEHDASRRIKTEFLLQFDGVGSLGSDRVLVLAATNRPQELDEAALRRFVKRIFIPLPEPDVRHNLLSHLLSAHKHSLSLSDFQKLVQSTDGYSASDLTALAREASLGPIRDLGQRFLTINESDIRPISMADFLKAISVIRKSVSPSSIKAFLDFQRDYGTKGV